MKEKKIKTKYRSFCIPINGKLEPVKYLYANPQFNRIIAVLENGEKVDYDLTLLDIFYNEFIEYKKFKEVDFAEAFKGFLAGKIIKSLVSNIEYGYIGSNPLGIVTHKELDGKWLVSKD